MKTKLIKAGLSVLGIVVGFLILEFGLWVFMPQQTLSKVQAFRFPCFEEGEKRWIKLKSNEICILESTLNPAFKSVVKTNSIGFRNPEIVKVKPQGTKRVLFIGDSFTMGWAVDEDKAFPRVTETLLNQKGIKDHAEAINAGFAAAGPSGYYLYLKNFGLDLDPDIVVIGFYIGNDITSRADVEWVKTDSGGLPEVVRSKSSYIDYSGQIREKSIPFKYKVPYLRDSHLFVFLMDRLFPPVVVNVTDPVITPLVCVFKKSCHDLDEGKQELEKLFLAMQKITSERGKKLVVAMIPVEFQAYENVRVKYGVAIPLLPSEKRYPNEEFGEFFAGNGIDYIDLLPVFAKSLGQRNYFEFDDHWNANGHRVAAEAIADHLSDVMKVEEK